MAEEKLVNLTGHDINVGGVDIPAENRFPARCYENVTDMGYFAGVPLVVKDYGRVVGLPDPQPGVIYIVSNIVRVANPERDDLASPGRKMVDGEGDLLGAIDLVVNKSRIERSGVIASYTTVEAESEDEEG